MQSCAFDFVLDKNNNHLIIELRYGFGIESSSKPLGYWASGLKWHEGKFNLKVWVVKVFYNFIDNRD